MYYHCVSYTNQQAEVAIKQWLMNNDVEHKMLRSVKSYYNFVFVRDKQYLTMLILKFPEVRFTSVDPQSAEGILSYYAGKTLDYI